MAVSFGSALVTSEVLNAASAEVEFNRISQVGRTVEYAQVGETPSLPHRISVKHVESGAGLSLRRRSLLRIDKTVVSGVDATKLITLSAYIVLDIPIGAMSAITEATNVMSELGSLVFTQATSTFKYDGTGNGSTVLLAGALSAS